MTVSYCLYADSSVNDNFEYGIAVCQDDERSSGHYVSDFASQSNVQTSIIRRKPSTKVDIGIVTGYSTSEPLPCLIIFVHIHSIMWQEASGLKNYIKKAMYPCLSLRDLTQQRTIVPNRSYSITLALFGGAMRVRTSPENPT